MKKYLVEFIGTFVLVFTIGMTVMGVEGAVSTWAPLAIGCALMTMVYAGGHVSGAHYNPAVTLAVFLRGKCAAAEVPGYMLSQVAGAAVAAMVVPYLKATGPDASAVVVVAKTLDPMRSLVAEFIFTFALAWVVLNVATAKATSGNSFYGLAIGLIVFAGAVSVGAVSGAAFNPAVAVGAIMMGLLKGSDLWIFLVANFAAGAAAAFAFKFVNKADGA